MSYDPLTSDFTVDLTIGLASYIVTSFNDSGASPIEVNFQNSDGSWRNRRMVAGERTATMNIECTNAAQAAPGQFETFEYEGQTWVVKNVSKALSSTAAAAWTLNLGWVSVAA